MSNWVLMIVSLLSHASMYYSQNEVRITYEPTDDGKYIFYGENLAKCPYTVNITFSSPYNIMSSDKLPYVGTVFPGKSQLFTTERKNKNTPFSLAY